MRNRDTLAKAGRTELFARKKAVENRAAGDPLIVLEKQANVLKDTLFAACIKIQDNVLGG